MQPNTRNSDTHSMREHCPPLPSVSLNLCPTTYQIRFDDPQLVELAKR